MPEEKEFSSFIQSYDNFMTPAAKIIIDGSDVIKNMQLCINSIQVRNSTKAADTCRFTISGVYDAKNHKFDGKIKEKFTLGTILSVQMGYSSALKTIFKGYISDLSYSFGEECSIAVTALDVRQLMTLMGRNILFQDLSYTALITQVMEKYKKVYTSLEIDSDLNNKQIISKQQDCSDYEFIQKITAETENEFFVEAGVVHIGKISKREFVVPVVGWGNGLTSFSRNVKYVQKGSVVAGYNREQQERIEVDGTCSLDVTQKEVFQGDTKEYLFFPDVMEKEKLEKIAKSKEKKKKEKGQSGDGEIIGLPDLIAGGQIKIKDTDSEMDGTYSVKEVIHNFSLSGFQTSFEVGSKS